MSVWSCRDCDAAEFFGPAALVTKHAQTKLKDRLVPVAERAAHQVGACPGWPAGKTTHHCRIIIKQLVVPVIST